MPRTVTTTFKTASQFSRLICESLTLLCQGEIHRVVVLIPRTLSQVIELPIKHPELFESLGVAQPKVFHTYLLAHLRCSKPGFTTSCFAVKALIASCTHLDMDLDVSTAV